ncbi:MAG: cation:proton antiporter [Puniceicoccaceae bacterium]
MSSIAPMLALESGEEMPRLVLLIGSVSAAALLLKQVFERFSLPPVVAYLLLGMLVAYWNDTFALFDPEGPGGTVLAFLSALGVIVLLFRVGIESDLHELREQLPRAAVIWPPNMILSGLPGYWVTRHLLGQELIPSLFVGVALTATSVGVSVAVWEETGKIRRREGSLLIDTAELDDISGVALMALLFSIAPVLRDLGVTESGPVGSVWRPLGLEIGGFLVRFGLFAAAMFVFGRYLETPLDHCTRRIGSKATVLIFVVGLGFVIAATAGLIGLSLPIGALFAGLLLSRHRKDYGVEPFYQSLYLFFTPFFFIHIGFLMDTSLLTSSLGAAGVLLAVAFLGKWIGAGVPARMFTGLYGAVLIGASMVPRAEISMIVIQRGRSLGDWAMPPDLYAAMVVVSAVTCLGTALFLHWALRRWD